LPEQVCCAQDLKQDASVQTELTFRDIENLEKRAEAKNFVKEEFSDGGGKLSKKITYYTGNDRMRGILNTISGI